MGWGIDWVFSSLIPNSRPIEMEYPCWMIALIVMTTCGYILPTFLVFVFEVAARSLFIKSIFSHERHAKVESMSKSAFRVAMLASAILFGMTWFFLTLILENKAMAELMIE